MDEILSMLERLILEMAIVKVHKSCLIIDIL